MTEHEAKKHALWPDFEKFMNECGGAPEFIMVDKFDCGVTFWWECFLAGARASSEFRAAVDEGENK